ncbi:MAG TPA: hypothetical protein VL201_03880 [Patescibacteria group bacterium]|jgi:hypothetical protein|nr:hypothetical protein [Patescibacteria group bacterium]
MILNKITKNIIFLLFIIMYSTNIFCMYLTQENYLTFLDTQPITEMVEKARNLVLKQHTIDFVQEKDNFTLLLQGFFQELENITAPICNKKDLWFIFNLTNMTCIATATIGCYYQRDRKLTDFFIDKTNSLFDSIEDEEDKRDAKICAFLNIKKGLRLSKLYSVLWNESTKKAFLYVPNFDSKNFPKTLFPWYNILAQNDDELHVEGITGENKEKIRTQYLNCLKSNNLCLLTDYITFIQSTQYKNILYVYSHKKEELIDFFLIHLFLPSSKDLLPSPEEIKFNLDKKEKLTDLFLSTPNNLLPSSEEIKLNDLLKEICFNLLAPIIAHYLLFRFISWKTSR